MKALQSVYIDRYDRIIEISIRFYQKDQYCLNDKVSIQTFRYLKKIMFENCVQKIIWFAILLMEYSIRIVASTKNANMAEMLIANI